MKYMILVVAGFAMSATPSFAAMTEANCQAEWKKLDANTDGKLDAAEMSSLKMSTTSSSSSTVGAGGEGTVTSAAFMENCKAGAYTLSQTAAKEGAAEARNGLEEGANSFTESQAKQRIADAGYSEISALAKDDKGIWRGTAKKGDAELNVAVDFKGNVVTN